MRNRRHFQMLRSFRWVTGRNREVSERDSGTLALTPSPLPPGVGEPFAGFWNTVRLSYSNPLPGKNRCAVAVPSPGGEGQGEGERQTILSLRQAPSPSLTCRTQRKIGFQLARPNAFSLIEILVVVGLLSIIILGLVAMFSQTQRAFRLGLAQVDVLESGRAVTDMMTRELSQMTPARASNAVNFYLGVARLPLALQPYKIQKQELPGDPAPVRTNLIEELFFLTKENQTWTGIGYYVSGAAGGVGTLYRYATNSYFGQNPAELFAGYNKSLNDAVDRNVFTNLNRIMDGVVHFKVRAYNPDGRWITTTNQFATNQFGVVVNAEVREPGSALYASGESEFYRLTTNAVPAFVELELGVLEERSIIRARTITDTKARSDYLAREAGKVHLFRLRVPVRNVDRTAYQ